MIQENIANRAPKPLSCKTTAVETGIFRGFELILLKDISQVIVFKKQIKEIPPRREGITIMIFYW